MRRWTEVSVEVDMDDVLESMTDREVRTLVAELIRDGYGPENAGPTLTEEELMDLRLDDPVVRLQAITFLRKKGYTVEPMQ